MKKLFIIKLSVCLLFFSGLENVSAAQAPALSDEIPAGVTVQEVTDELVSRVYAQAVTPVYMQACLRFGVDADTRIHADRTTLLMAAVCRTDIPLVKILLEHGAQADLVDRNGEVALSYIPMFRRYPYKLTERVSEQIAATKGILELFGKAGADLNAVDHQGYTYLMKSCHYPEVMKYFITENMNLDVQDTINGSTALMHAVCLLNLQSTALLLDSGANPLATDKAGRTALYHLNVRARRADCNNEALKIRELLINAEDEAHKRELLKRASDQYLE